MITIAFFNNKGGVGKTSLVYHLAWAFSDLGLRVLVADLDPQSNLTALCVDEDRLEQLWAPEEAERQTISGAIYPLKEELGDLANVDVEAVSRRIGLLVGDIDLATFEAKLSEAWPRCLDRHAPSFRATSAFHRAIQQSGGKWGAHVALVDVGPNLGAINRAALIAAQSVVTPLNSDLFSIQGLRNLGPTLSRWRTEWQERVAKNPVPGLDLPAGSMTPAGYVVVQPNLYGGAVTKAYQKWISRVPIEYTKLTGSDASSAPSDIGDDPHCLGILKHYRSLMALAHEARKPIFQLAAADGALGAHATAARDAGKDFRILATKIASSTGLLLPSPS